MSKAEERGYKAYPYNGDYRGQGDSNSKFREAYINGYHQAEKDLALTIEDIEKIHTFLYAIKNNKQGVFTFTRLSDEKYQEVLKRFNKIRNE